MVACVGNGELTGAGHATTEAAGKGYSRAKRGGSLASFSRFLCYLAISVCLLSVCLSVCLSASLHEKERKIQLDIEEAKFQAEKRRDAIKRARALQYAQTDRVKALQGAVLLTDVLRERELQQKIKIQRYWR